MKVKGLRREDERNFFNAPASSSELISWMSLPISNGITCGSPNAQHCSTSVPVQLVVVEVVVVIVVTEEVVVVPDFGVHLHCPAVAFSARFDICSATTSSSRANSGPATHTSHTQPSRKASISMASLPTSVTSVLRQSSSASARSSSEQASAESRGGKAACGTAPESAELLGSKLWPGGTGDPPGRLLMSSRVSSNGSPLKVPQ
mmetsp:Transcript_63487/g.160121  ORF Transcript_63487/g.160121 Transcript_63487/m.160121 type:complete len:204 (+) Transcript_63487:1369-1980(+)